MKWKEDLKIKIGKLLKQGKKRAAIASELGLPFSLIQSIIDKNKLDKPFCSCIPVRGVISAFCDICGKPFQPQCECGSVATEHCPVHSDVGEKINQPKKLPEKIDLYKPYKKPIPILGNKINEIIDYLKE